MTPLEKEAALYATKFVFRRLGYVVGAVAVVALGYLLRGVLVPLFLAFLIAYTFNPVVERLSRRGVSRTLAAILLLLLLMGAAVAVVTVAIPYFIDEFASAAAALPTQLKGLQERLDPWVWDRFHVRIPHTWGDVTRDYGDEMRKRLPQVAEGMITAVFGTFNVVAALAGSLIIPVFALYLLMDFDVIIQRAAMLIPRRYVSTGYDIAREVHTTLGRYVRGQVTASFVLAFLYSAGLRALDLRLAIPIGVITGMLAFVPYIGFGVGLLMALGMAVLDWRGPGTLVGVLVVMLAGQVLDGLLVTPRIVGGSVGLKPIEVLLTMMAAATLFGFVGVLLAVPIGAVVKILLNRAAKAYLQSVYYRQIPPATTPTPLPGAKIVGIGDLPTPLPQTQVQRPGGP